MQRTPAVLRRCISKALDRDAFAIISSRAPAEFLSHCIVIDQAQKLSQAEANSAQRILPSTVGQNIALLDRTGDIQLAAREIVASCLAFRGRGRYAIDLVLVNEFVADDLVSALSHVLEKQSISNKETVPPAQRKTTRSSPEDSMASMIDEKISSKEIKSVKGDSKTGIIEIIDR